MRVILAVLLAAQVASAQPAREVTREFQAGVDAFRLGKHHDARKHLERATQLDPKLPGPHRFLAAVAQAQGRFADCVTSARAAIELNPASQELADTRKLHDDCRRSAGRPAYGQELGDKAAIGVTANVDGAAVKISGLVYGATPIEPRPIPAGAHEVELTKAGYLPAKRSVTALSGIVTDVEIDLAPDPEATGRAEGRGKVVTRATGLLIVKRLSVAHPTVADANSDGFFIEVLIDGALRSRPSSPNAEVDPRYDLAPGIHVVEVRSAGADPWRRRVRVVADQTVEVEVTPVITVRRERTRARGLWLIGGGGALGGFGSAALYHDWNVLAAASFGGAAIAIGIGIWAYARGQRPDLTGPPPLALVSVEGGVIATTGVGF